MTPDSPLFHDPTLWLVFSFATFIILAFVFGRQSIMGSLDTKIEKIRNDIASAEKLHAEADAMLASYKSNLQNASVEADRIIAKAKIQADDIRKQAEKDFEDTMARRESMLKTRIEQMERSAVDDIRRYAAELAVSATSEIISQKLSSQSANSLADDSINRISEKLN
jgi:F-type H+-transporting ATPase subunit b